jgi:membrane associated rhomboid family serine protease
MDNPSPRRSKFQQRLGLGGPAGGQGIFSVPSLVAWLLWLMVAIFLIQAVLPERLSLRIDWALAFIPVRFTYGLENAVNPFEVMVPLFGHVFVHATVTHLLFNGLWLLVFGTGVARRFHVERGAGVDRFANNILFVTFFMLCGLAGALAYYMGDRDATTLLVGASGAISGLMAGALLFALRPFALQGPEFGPLASMTARPVAIASAAYVGLNVLTGFGVGPEAGMNIAWEAHIGGFVCGLVTFPLFDRAVRRSRRPGRRYFE